MDIAEASRIAEANGCYVRFDDTVKLYAIYVGLSHAYIRPADFEALGEDQYRNFLAGFCLQEADDIARYGVIQH